MKTLQLNLGSGKDYIDGWTNVDIEDQYHPDVLADITKPLPFPNGSASYIKAYDILEHVTKEDAPEFLKECHRVLDQRGTLSLRTPNMYAIIDSYSHDPEVMAHFLYGDTSETGVYGAHKAGYTEKSLRRLLLLCGFTEIHIQTEQTNYIATAVKSDIPFKEHISVGVIQQSADYGGAEAYMISLVQEWKHEGHAVHMATTEGKFYQDIEKIATSAQSYSSTVDFIGDWKGFLKSLLLLPHSIIVYARVLRDFKQKGVEVLVMSEFSERLFVAFLAWIYRIPVVWIEYGRPQDTFKRMFPWSKILFRLLKDIPARYITPTHYVQKSLMTDGRVSLAKIDIIPCGTTIPQSVKKSGEKKPLIIGCISRLAVEKGQRDLLHAVPELIKKYALQVWIIGKGPDELYLKKRAKELGIQKHVIFKGFVKKNTDLYKDIDIVVFPSTWELEGFGLVLIEAMAHGIPVVASAIGPVPEVVGDAAVLYQPGNQEELIDALTKVLANRALSRRLVEKGRSRVIDKFAIRSQAQKMIEGFRTALCE